MYVCVYVYVCVCVLNLEKMPQKRMECFSLLLEHLAWIEHQFLSCIRDSRKAGSLWGMMRGVGGVWQSKVTGSKVWTIGRVRNYLDAHLGQIVSDKDGIVDWCIVQVEMPLTRFEECWPLPTKSLPELP